MRSLAEGAAPWAIPWPCVHVRANVRGPVVHDARIAAIGTANGLRTLRTADRDFGRFPALRVDNPLVDRRP